MARIKGSNTSPELRLRSQLWRTGLRFRIHVKLPHGCPDVVFTKARVLIFIDGCQWHGCPYHYVRPKTRSDFWGAKLTANVKRDCEQTRRFEADGWRVCRFWEHQVFEDVHDVVRAVQHALERSNTWEPQPAERVIRVEPIDEQGTIERRFLIDLRNPKCVSIHQRKRTTTKWKRTYEEIRSAPENESAI
jgi:DNA mismatch endonuclease (patch repair protein)